MMKEISHTQTNIIQQIWGTDGPALFSEGPWSKGLKGRAQKTNVTLTETQTLT